MVFKLRGRAIAQGAVSATRVVESFDIVEDHQFSGGFGGRNRVGEAFGFQRSDETFSQGVVIRIALAAHARGDAPGPQALLEGVGGVLAATITVVDEASEGPLTGHCMLEGRRGQLSEHVLIFLRKRGLGFCLLIEVNGLAAALKALR